MTKFFSILQRELVEVLVPAPLIKTSKMWRIKVFDSEYTSRVNQLSDVMWCRPTMQ